MSNYKMFFNKIIVFTITAVGLVGCSSNFAESVRKVTYPPDFKYTEKAELRSNMQSLAFQIRLLDEALNKPLVESEDKSEEQRKQVLSALNIMGRIAAKLKAGDTGTNHPFADNYMQDLAAKIDEARIAASLQQPRYYYAGKVSGACINCHKVNR